MLTLGTAPLSRETGARWRPVLRAGLEERTVTGRLRMLGDDARPPIP